MGLLPSVNPLKNSKGKQIRANLSDSAMLHLEKTPSGRVQSYFYIIAGK